MNTVASKVVLVNGDFLDLAFAWGKEDATEGKDMGGSEWFLEGPALNAYNAGYKEGKYLANALSGGNLTGELELMNAVLDSMRIEKGRPAECALADQWLQN